MESVGTGETSNILGPSVRGVRTGQCTPFVSVTGQCPNVDETTKYQGMSNVNVRFRPSVSTVFCV